MKKHLQPLTPAALYARVSSDRQDVELSVSAQLRALRDYAKSNGYSVAREYIDEAESGRVADRPQFREMIEEAASRRLRSRSSWSGNSRVYVVKTSGTKGEPLKRATWTLTGSGSSQICQPPFG